MAVADDYRAQAISAAALGPPTMPSRLSARAGIGLLARITTRSRKWRAIGSAPHRQAQRDLVVAKKIGVSSAAVNWRP
jgi:hypothetical protein